VRRTKIKMEILTDFTLKISESKIYKLHGLKNSREDSPRLKEKVAQALNLGSELISPRVLFETFEVDHIDYKEGNIFLVGLTDPIQTMRISQALKEASKVILFVLTIGEAIENKVASLSKENNQTTALFLDTVGSIAAEGLADLFQERIKKRFQEKGMAISMRFSPGYCDWPVEGQKLIFSSLNPIQIGVTLTESMMMIPRKSISGLIGIGKTKKKFPSPCTLCDLPSCPTRR